MMGAANSLCVGLATAVSFYFAATLYGFSAGLIASGAVLGTYLWGFMFGNKTASDSWSAWARAHESNAWRRKLQDDAKASQAALEMAIARRLEQRQAKREGRTA